MPLPTRIDPDKQCRCVKISNKFYLLTLFLNILQYICKLNYELQFCGLGKLQFSQRMKGSKEFKTKKIAKIILSGARNLKDQQDNAHKHIYVSKKNEGYHGTTMGNDGHHSVEL